MVNKDNSASDRRKWIIASVGSVLPETHCMQTPACNVSGNKFQIELLKAIRAATGAPIYTISTLPIGVFPKSKQIVSPAAAVDIADGISGLLIPFINVLFLKQISVGVMNFVLLSIWLWKHRRERRFVLVYNLYPPMSYPVLTTTRLFGGKAIAIVPDFPHNLSFDFHGWRGLLQRLNVWFEATALRYFDGSLPFTRYVTEDFAPGRPALVMEGGVDTTELDTSVEMSSGQPGSGDKICFFAGTLYAINGIDLLLEAFELIPDPSFKLWIFGRGPLEERVKLAARRDPRVVFWGFQPNAEVMRRQRQATLLLNIRPTSQLITRYTFPSKLREYMLSGRPVLSTALPGIPGDYFDHIYLVQDETPQAVAARIQHICSRPADELAGKGLQAHTFILETRRWDIQGKRICEFMEALDEI